MSTKMNARRVFIISAGIFLALAHFIALFNAPSDDEIARALAADIKAPAQGLPELVAGIQAEIAVQNICDVFLLVLVICLLAMVAFRASRAVLATSLLYFASLVCFMMWAIGAFKYGVLPALGSSSDHLWVAASSGKSLAAWLSVLRITSVLIALFTVVAAYRLNQESRASRRT